MTPVERSIMYETSLNLFNAGVTLEEALEDLTEEEAEIVRSTYALREELA